MSFRALFSISVFTIFTAAQASARAQESPSTSASTVDEQRLARELRLEDVLAIALARNPDLGEARARAAAAAATARQASRLPETQLKYEQWGVPLRRPWDVGMADAVMVGVNQTFLAPGARRSRTAVANAEAAATALGEETRRREITAQVRRAFAEYYRTDRQLALHQEHVALTNRLVDLARGAYRAGTTSQQDVLKLTLELSRIHGQLARMEPERRAARALLNALMNRPLDAALGSPAELTVTDASAASSERDTRGRTELRSAKKAIERGEAAVALAKANATWPSLMVGVDYMYMPMNEHAHGYGAMVAINLPWLSPGRRDEIRAAEQTVLAERRALASVENALAFEAIEAETRYEASRAAYEVIERDAITQAERKLDAARAAYAGGRGDGLNLIDALRSYLDVRIERVRALAELEAARADLDRALGRQPREGGRS
jgi:outer membrane protein, heavy metal efflux system